MSPPYDFERRLTDWLDDQAPMREPDGLTDAVLARTRRTRRMPGWPGIERWFPVTVITRPALMPPLRAAWILVILALAVALAMGAAVVGSRLLAPALRATALIPQGDAAVIAYAMVGSSPEQLAGDIYTARADGTDVRHVTSGAGVDSNPTWSPDGRRIAFHRWQSGADSLVVTDAGGGDPMTLATNPATSQDCLQDWATAWSPDGTSLIFPTRDGCAGGFDLNIVAADGSSPATKLLADGTNSVFGTWSPDGSRIAFLGSEATGNSGLYVVDAGPDGAVGGGLKASRIASDIGYNLANLQFGNELDQPRWSPDGTQLAVTSLTKGAFLEGADGVLVVNADGSGQRLLATLGGNPAWSPDGRQVAFQRVVDDAERANGRPCTVRTWLIDRDGSNERQLDELGDSCGTPPLWSPDGTRIASVLITPQGGRESGQDPLFWFGIVMVDGSHPPVNLGDAYGTWQPVVAPLPTRSATSPS